MLRNWVIFVTIIAIAPSARNRSSQTSRKRKNAHFRIELWVHFFVWSAQRFTGFLQVPIEPALCHRIYEEATYHNHRQCLDLRQFLKLGLHHPERGLLEVPEPPFHRAMLVLVRHLFLKRLLLLLLHRSQVVDDAFLGDACYSDEYSASSNYANASSVLC